MSEPIRLGGVPEHVNLPWHQALAGDGFPDAGIQWTDMPGGTGQMMQALADGELDAAVVLTEGAIAAIVGGVPARVVRVFVTSPLHWGVHVAGGSALTEDALGAEHRFAVSRLGSGSHLMAHVLADRLGFEVDDDRFVVVGDVDGARAALANDEADVFLWDRFMTAPLVDRGEFARIGVQPTPWPAFVIAVHEDLLAGGRSVEVANLLAAAAEAADAFVDQDVDDAVAQIVDAYGLAEADAQAWLDLIEYDEGEPVDEDDFVEIAEQLAELGLIDEAPEPDDLVFPL